MTFGELKPGDTFRRPDGGEYVKTTPHRPLDKRSKATMNAVDLKTGKSLWMDDRVAVIKCEAK